MARLDQEDSNAVACFKLARGMPGPVTVLGEFLGVSRQASPPALILAPFERHQILGEDIWLLYKACGREITALHSVMDWLDARPGSADRLRQAIRVRGPPLGLEAIRLLIHNDDV